MCLRTSLDRSVIVAEGFLKLRSLFMLIKLKSFYSVLNKGKSTISSYLCNWPVVLSFASDNLKLFSEISSENLDLDDSGIFLPAFPSKTV